MFKRIFWGLLLIPFTAATFYHLPQLLFGLKAQVGAILFLGAGTVGYFLFEALFERPMRTYVFGHELTHALAGIAVGSKVHSFKVSKKGGSVTLSKSNFFVALAPYCVPLYTLLVILIYSGLRYFYPFPYMDEAAQVLTGGSLAFHASLTFYAIQQKQPDIHKTGLLFSMIFILLVNAWVLVTLSKVLFWNSVGLREFGIQTLKTQIHIWEFAVRQLYDWGWAAYEKLGKSFFTSAA